MSSEDEIKLTKLERKKEIAKKNLAKARAAKIEKLSKLRENREKDKTEIDDSDSSDEEIIIKSKKKKMYERTGDTPDNLEKMKDVMNYYIDSKFKEFKKEFEPKEISKQKSCDKEDPQKRGDKEDSQEKEHPQRWDKEEKNEIPDIFKNSGIKF